MRYDIVFTVTNDLSYDQRMQRICSSLSAHYSVLLIGRKRKKSIPLIQQPFHQKRINCWFDRSILFYIEYNLRLLGILLFISYDRICAIDLDSIIPVYFSSLLKKKKRVYDAHEIFTEQKEILSRKLVHAVWLTIEKKFVPKFMYGYTVNSFIADELNKRYGVNYQIIKNLPTLKSSSPIKNMPSNSRYILYQGAVNEGRCFEQLIPAMKQVDCKLIVCGEGNFYQQAQALVNMHGLQHKIEFKGMIPPSQLVEYTNHAYIGITLFEKEGMNQYYSLANRFFDYIMSSIPQICVNYPAYKQINDEYHIAELVDEPTENNIITALNNLLENDVHYFNLKKNTERAKQQLCWEQEEIKLIYNWKNIYI